MGHILYHFYTYISDKKTNKLYNVVILYIKMWICPLTTYNASKFIHSCTTSINYEETFLKDLETNELVL